MAPHFFRAGFASEGSALRAATKSNPRAYDCPTCGSKNVLTLIDVQRGYQCDRCADIAEGHGSPTMDEY